MDLIKYLISALILSSITIIPVSCICKITSFSNSVKAFLPDKWQVSHLLHHMACYSSHTICHCFLTVQHSSHGSKKEVSTVDGALLVKTVTLGELKSQIWMLHIYVLPDAFFKAPCSEC